MPRTGNVFYDEKGKPFDSPKKAIESDIAVLLGRNGDHRASGIVEGIASTIVTNRTKLVALLNELEEMEKNLPAAATEEKPKLTAVAG
jgi:hypothetical protein